MEQIYPNGSDMATSIKKPYANKYVRHLELTLKYEDSKCKNPVSLYE